MDNEAALITKIVQKKDISKILNSKVSHCFILYPEVWEYIQDYYIKYRTVPTSDIIRGKFDYFQGEVTPDEVTIDYLMDEVASDFLNVKLEEMISNTIKIIDEDKNPREALNYLFGKSSALGHQTDVVKDVDLISDYWMRLGSLKERVAASDAGKELGIPSLMSPIDVLYGGWQPGDFVTLMGWTGSGKTWLSTNFAVNAWKMGKKPLYFSLEMDDKQFGYRVDTILAEGKLSNTALMNGRNIQVDEYEAWAKEVFHEQQPFYIVTNEGLDEISQYTVQMKIEQYKPDLVILDYHSLFDDAKKGRSETEKHRNLSKDFKRLAVKYSIPIIDVVAVTMDGGHGERPPELNEVAWSKQLAYDSDLVLSVVKIGHSITVEAKKSRRSDLFAFNLNWDFDTGRIDYQGF